jgi:hypothetical protein
MAVKSKANPKYVTPKFIEEEFGISRSTVQNRLDTGAIKSIQIPPADPSASKIIRKIPWSEVEKLRKSSGQKK